MHAPSAIVRRIAVLGSAPAAVLVAGLMVWQGTNAAFSAETHNAGNNWASGSVLLTNDGSGGAMFSIANVVPMQTGSHCIVVTSSSPNIGIVKTYFTNTTPDGLENNLTLKVEQGTGGSYSSCAGFVPVTTVAAQPLATIFTNNATYGTGMLPWTTTGSVSGESMTYRFTWVFDTTGLSQTAVNALQNKSVRTDIEWELQNS